MASELPRWVLYVAHDAYEPERLCPGSRKCVGILEVSERLKRECSVQVVDHLRQSGESLPGWLDGTPILVDRTAKQLYRGTGVCTFLTELARGQHAPPAGAVDGAAAVDAADKDDPFERIGPPGGEPPIDDRGKVTEEQLQEYIRARAASVPSYAAPP